MSRNMRIAGFAGIGVTMALWLLFIWAAPSSAQAGTASGGGAASTSSLPTASGGGAASASSLPTASGGGAASASSLPTASGSGAASASSLPTASGGGAASASSLPTASGGGAASASSLPTTSGSGAASASSLPTASGGGAASASSLPTTSGSGAAQPDGFGPVALGLFSATSVVDEAGLIAALADATVDTINVGATIQLTQSMVVPQSRTVTIQSTSVTTQIRSATGLRHFVMERGSNLSLSQITLHGMTDGGGILLKSEGAANLPCTLTLTTANITNCNNTGPAVDAYSHPGSQGAAITINDACRLADNANGGLAIQKGLQLILNGQVYLVNNQTSGNGGAISAVDTPITINGDAQLQTNTASGKGGAVYATGSGGMNILGNIVFSSNTAQSGGAIAAENYTGNIDLTGNVTQGFSITDNTADTGGALYLDGMSGTLSVSGVMDISGNAATGTTGGGAVYANNSGGMDIRDFVSFSYNTSNNGKGGAIYSNGATQGLTLREEATLEFNSAQSGGAVYVSATSSKTLIRDSVDFSKNSATQNGGALCLEGAGQSTGPLWTQDSIRFYQNTATAGGGAIYIKDSADFHQMSGRTLFNGNTANYGGALYLTNLSGAVHMKDNTLFDGNKAAMDGGGVFAEKLVAPAVLKLQGAVPYGMAFSGNKALGGSGGAMSLQYNQTGGAPVSSLVTVEGQVAFSDNTAQLNGGAISVVQPQMALDIATDGASDVQFLRNQASTNNGGAIYQYQSGLTIGAGTLFDGNNCASTAQTDAGGGAVYCRAGTMSIEGTGARPVVIQNGRAASGGALCLANGANANIAYAQMLNNSAANLGGAMDVDNSQNSPCNVVVAHSLMQKNVAQNSGGGISLGGGTGCQFTMEYCTVDKNSAGGAPHALGYRNATANGGGIYTTPIGSSGVLELSHCTVTNNVAPKDGGGIGFGYSVAQPVNLDDFLPRIQMQNTQMTSNAAQALYNCSDPVYTAIHSANINPGEGGVAYSWDMPHAYNNFDIQYKNDPPAPPAPQVTVTYDARGGAPQPAAVTVPYFSTLDKPGPDPQLSGASFLGWETEDGNLWGFNTPGASDGAPATHNMTLYARWDIVMCRVDFMNGTTRIDRKYVRQNTPVAQTAVVPVPPPHSDFSHWKDSASGLAWDFNNLVSRDLVLQAVWAERTYAVMYNTSGGTPAPTARRVHWGDTGLLPAQNPDKTNYDFVRWDVTSGGNGGPGNTGVAAGASYGDLALNDSTLFITLTAVYKPRSYTIHYLPGAGSGVSGLPADGSAAFGSHYTLPTAQPQRQGYQFIGWQMQPGGQTLPAGGSFAVPGQNVTLTALWQAAPAPSSSPSQPGPPPAPQSSSAASSRPRPAPSRSAASASSSEASASSGAVAPSASRADSSGPTSTGPASGGTPSDPGRPGPATPVLPEISGLDGRALAQIALQTGHPLADILQGHVPLGNVYTSGTWSFMSLLFALAAVIITLADGGVSLWRRRHNGARRPVVLAVSSLVDGIMTPVLWLVLDNLRQPLTWINRYTPLIGLLLASCVVLKLLAYTLTKRQQQGGGEPPPAA